MALIVCTIIQKKHEESKHLWSSSQAPKWEDNFRRPYFWKTIHVLSNRAPPPTLNTSTNQVQEAIKQSKNNNSQGPDKLNIMHLKDIDPLGLAFLTSMLKTALNTNIIPHIWKLANIVPIPKPNKYLDNGTSYRPISLLSVIAKTLEKSLHPYITANIPDTPREHGYKTQHSTVTAIHTLNNTVAKGFRQIASPARRINVALDMSKAFDTINIHTLVRKLLQTNIPGTIMKFIAIYIKGRKSYITYRNQHPYNINLKLPFLQVASSRPHYSTFTSRRIPTWRFCMDKTTISH